MNDATWLQQLTLWISVSIKRDNCFWHTVRKKRQHSLCSTQTLYSSYPSSCLLGSSSTLNTAETGLSWVVTVMQVKWTQHSTGVITYLWSEIFSAEQLLYPQPVIPLPFSDLNKIRSYGKTNGIATNKQSVDCTHCPRGNSLLLWRVVGVWVRVKLVGGWEGDRLFRESLEYIACKYVWTVKPLYISPTLCMAVIKRWPGPIRGWPNYRVTTIDLNIDNVRGCVRVSLTSVCALCSV